MNVVLAIKLVRIRIKVVDSLNLDSGVEKVVFATTEVCHGSEGLKRLHRFDMDAHTGFSYRYFPAMQVVHINNFSLRYTSVDVLLERRGVN